MHVPVLDPRTGAARGLRALVLAVVAVGVSGAAHTFVDGCVDVVGLALALGCCWPAAVALLGRRQRVGAVVAWAAAAQVVTHVLVSLTCGGAAPSTPLRVLVAHGLAVVVTTTLVARGDDGLWVAHALRRALGLRLPKAPALVVPGRALPRTRARVARPRPRWSAGPELRRGPPAALLPTP